MDDNEENGGNAHLPKDDALDMQYTCVMHAEINAINTSIFNDCNIVTYPMEVILI